MANIWEVADSLALLTHIDDSEKQTVMGICEISLKEINSRLRHDADFYDPRITAAAAAQAFYTLCVRRNTSASEANMSGFKAGDLSISYDKADSQQQLKLAGEIRDNALKELTPLLKDNGFYVGMVDI